MPTTIRSIHTLLSLTGRSYIVTGGAQGIGYAITHGIAELGGNVAVLDIQSTPREDLDALAQKFNVQIPYFAVDVSDEAALKKACEDALQALGDLDGAVTAAGIAIDKDFREQTWADAERIHKVNVMGTFAVAQFTIAHLTSRKKPGSIVTISSITAHVGLPGYRMTSYNASKGAVSMLTKALATEFAPHGIRVNAIAPAFTDTEQTQTVRGANPKAVHHMWDAPPLGRIGEADEMMGAVCYLLSDAAGYTTGAEVLITGGIHLGRHGDYADYR